MKPIAYVFNSHSMTPIMWTPPPETTTPEERRKREADGRVWLTSFIAMADAIKKAGG